MSAPDPAAEQLAQIRSRFAETWIEVSRRDVHWLLAHVDLITAERDILRIDLARAQAERQQYYTALQGCARREAEQAARINTQRRELADLRASARSAAVSLRDTAERVEQGRTVNAVALRAAATALDDITGGTP